jgi:deoxyribonuclease-4
MSPLSFRFGTVGSPTSTPKKPGGSVGAIYRLRELGLNSLELGWVRSVRISEETCGLIRSASENNDVALSVHAPYYINLNADEQEWPKSRQRLMDAAHYGNLAGATDIVFHPGSYFGRPPEEVLPLATERLEQCIAELRQADNSVALRPETMGKIAMLGSLEDTLKIARALPEAEPCIDFAHLHARAGDGSMNSYDEWMDVLKAYQEALGEAALKRLHIHMSGIEYTAKGEREHLPLEESDLNLKAILQALYDCGAGGRIVCESPILEDDALLIQKEWLAINKESET